MKLGMLGALSLLLLSSCVTFKLGRFDYIEFKEDVVDVTKSESQLAGNEVEGKYCVGAAGLDHMYSNLLSKTADGNGDLSGLKDFLIYSEGLCLKLKGTPIKGGKKQ